MCNIISGMFKDICCVVALLVSVLSLYNSMNQNYYIDYSDNKWMYNASLAMAVIIVSFFGLLGT